MTVPVVPLTLAFFSGRRVSYSIYVIGASAAEETLGGVFSDSLRSPIGIAAQLVMLGLLVILVQVDWTRVLGPKGQSDPPAR